ncbi:slufate transporter 2;1 [Actinidia rufa]|uniref:Slufate transporter 21 n=1 Tax=Actinidia rufa TaxID=165716 RepID=A0A7J0EHZ6_9ERIC|nr:slufate transporter 2;1 [Actinidia rufa]
MMGAELEHIHEWLDRVEGETQWGQPPLTPNVHRRGRLHQNKVEDLDEFERDVEEEIDRMSVGSHRRYSRDRGARNKVDHNLGSIKMKIPAFQGKSDPEAYLEWEKKMELIFDCHNYLELKRSHETTICTTKSHYRDLYLKLHGLYQGNWSVDEYYKEMEIAMIRANVEEDREATISRFLNDLNREIANTIEIHHYVELEDLVHMTIKVERQLKKGADPRCIFRCGLHGLVFSPIGVGMYIYSRGYYKRCSNSFEFTQTLQTTMGSFSVEDQQPEVENKGRIERTRWVLNSPNPPSLLQELISSVKETIFPYRSKLSSSSPKQPRSRVFLLLQGLFPILSWARNYKASKFKNDLMAGLTLASLCIPQSIGYANLANLDPQYGLYTSVVPPLIYALMGSSREIAIGPVVFTVTFFAGAFQAIFGLLRLGFLVDFLSHAAIVGFMGGGAIIIGLQQLKGLLGISHFTTKTDVVSVLEAVFRSFHYPGRRNKKLFWVPAVAPLISVILSTLIVYLTKADKHGVKIVKHFKGGLNPSSAHQLQFRSPHVGQAAKIGLICAVVALTEAIAVGRSFASIKGYHIDGKQGNGSFSRTAVNFSAGCETVVSNIVMAITVLVSLELLTRLLYYFTPIAILASIILSALPGLIDLNEAYNIYKVDKLDFLACIGAFFGVLFSSVEIGLLTAEEDGKLGFDLSKLPVTQIILILEREREEDGCEEVTDGGSPWSRMEAQMSSAMSSSSLL